VARPGRAICVVRRAGVQLSAPEELVALGQDASQLSCDQVTHFRSHDDPTRMLVGERRYGI
jgi:hypothetical protein